MWSAWVVRHTCIAQIASPIWGGTRVSSSVLLKMEDDNMGPNSGKCMSYGVPKFWRFLRSTAATGPLAVWRAGSRRSLWRGWPLRLRSPLDLSTWATYKTCQDVAREFMFEEYSQQLFPVCKPWLWHGLLGLSSEWQPILCIYTLYIK